MSTDSHDRPDVSVSPLQAQIVQHLSEPAALERIYRSDKNTFKKVFNALYPDIKENIVAQAWYERLNSQMEETVWGHRNEWFFVGLTIFLAGMIIKIPDVSGIDREFFYTRNLPFAVIPMIASYFLWIQNAGWKKILFPLAVLLISAVYINLLPNDQKSDTIILASIHLPIFLWIVAGYFYPAEHGSVLAKRIAFLRFNGDLVVMSAVMGMAGFLFSGITMGLFLLTGTDISSFFKEYILPWGGPSIPILAAFLVQKNPTLVSRISPLIARIFTPLIFVMLVFFLGTISITAKDPYNDREFLLLFNVLLIGVMAVILFSLSEAGKHSQNRFHSIALLALAVVTIVANSIALSAISFRIVEYGITPNRLAVLGSNILFFVNLVWVAWQLFKSLKNSSDLSRVEIGIASFFPLYGAWAAGVAMGFPLLFGLR
jgi:hypothetical protein